MKNRRHKLLALSALLFAALLAPCILLAQPPATQWSHRFGRAGTDGFNAVAQVPDGGFIAAGMFGQTSPSSHRDLWVMKTNAAGDSVFSRTYGGSSRDEAATVAPTPDGGYIVGGRTISTNGDVTGAHGMGDAWILKLNSAGGVVWKRAYGGSGADECSKILSQPDGTFIVLGSTASDDGDLAGANTVGFFGESNVWLMKLDAGGNILWQKTYGGPSFDAGFDMARTADGGFALCGTEATQFGMYDMWVCRTDSVGGVVWEKVFGYADYEQAYAVLVTPANDVLVAGSTLTTTFPGFNGGPSDAVVAKLNGASGALLWQKCFGGTGAESITGITVQNGRYVLAGTSSSTSGLTSTPLGQWDVWLVAIDDSASVQWMKNFGGSAEDGNGYNTDIITAADGSLVVASMTGSPEVSGGGGLWDGYLFRLGTNPTDVEGAPLASDVAICPNPATNTLHMRTSEQGRKFYRFMGLRCETLLSGHFEGGQCDIDIKALIPGSFVVQIWNGEGRMLSRIIVKQ